MVKVKDYLLITGIFLLFLVITIFFNPEFHVMGDLDDNPNEIIITRAVTPLRVSAPEIAVFAPAETSGVDTIRRTLGFLRQDFIELDRLQNLGGVWVLIVAAPYYSEHDITAMRWFLSHGGSIIFAKLPHVVSDDLAELIGIASFEPNYNVHAVDIYEGIFISGKFRAEELPMPSAFVRLSGHCKIYAHGYAYPGRPEEPIDLAYADRTPLIWRTFYQGGAVYAVNAPFFDDINGMGVLAGLLALALDDFIYPVIGTKTVALDNFPYITTHDMLINHRTSYVFARDIMWPNLTAMSRESGLTYTAFTNGGFNNSYEAFSALNFFSSSLHLLGRGELGYSFEHGVSPAGDDLSFLAHHFPGRSIRSVMSTDNAQITDFSQATAVFAPGWDDAFTWLNDSAVVIPQISHGIDSDVTRFAFTSAVTTMGFAFHTVDLAPVFHGEYSWVSFSRDMSIYLSLLFGDLDFLQAVSARNAAEAVKNYLNSSVNVSRHTSGMDVSITGGQTSFILRTRNTVGSTTADSLHRISDGVYFIANQSENFSIEWERTS